MVQPSPQIGRLTFEFETFTFGTDATRKRPTKVSGTLSKFVSVPAARPLCNFAGGDTDGVADPMEGYDKGHVIMVSHSGVSAAENIVPMYPCFNQAGGIWRELEQRIADYTALTIQPGVARQMSMLVEIEYAAGDPRFPTAFIVTVQDGGLGGAYLYFKGVKLDKLRFTHLPTAPAKIDPIAEIGAPAMQLIANAKAAIELSGWRIENRYPANNPPLLAPLTDIPVRPYAMLDYLWLERQDQWITTFLTTGSVYRHRFGAQFHERQKMLIRIVNAIYNQGVIKSDYPGDTTDALIVGSGKRAAQVDHVFAYDDCGGNLFSNALIASGEYNNRMRTKSAAVKWADRSGANLYGNQRHL